MQAVKTMGLLRNPGFDMFFIVGIPLIAIASGLLVMYDNNLFLPVLAADLWFLGYHHVISTYTRLAFDKQSLLEHKALVFYLLPAVCLAVVLLAVYAGPWVVTTVYIYWQWWHYTRQSEGISRAYAGKSKDMQTGKPAVPYVAYVLSHFAIYFMAYLYHSNIDYGWLTINIWHNAQYILFVWLFNNRRFNGQPSDTQKFLSTISQNGRFILYMATCLTLSTLIYFLITSYLSDAVSNAFTFTATMSGLIIYQTLNFHHYIVDSLIWKLRKPKIRQTLGID